MSLETALLLRFVLKRVDSPPRVALLTDGYESASWTPMGGWGVANETADALVAAHWYHLTDLARQVWDDPKLLKVYRSPATSGAHVDLESTIRNTIPVGYVVDYRAETSPDVPPGTLVVRVCSHGRTE